MVVAVRGANGVPLLCCWDECEKVGDYRVRVLWFDNPRRKSGVNYVFCSERHKLYWLHSKVKYGNLPSGFKYRRI